MNFVETPPFAPTLIESTRAIGYSLETALADIIDNSISADASQIDIYFLLNPHPYIAILDNGKGMDEKTLNIAMQYGSKNPNEERSPQDLGRFGLGLKTASLSQCRKLTVLSKSKEEINGRQWDIDLVKKNGTWTLGVLNANELVHVQNYNDLLENKSGTLVIWENLDRLGAGETNFEKALSSKMSKVREHIALVFHRYLVGEKNLKKITITINNYKIKAADPFLLGKSTRPMDDEILQFEHQKVLIRPYILPHTSKLTKENLEELGGEEGLRKTQGFYIYRNKRLIVWGTWFRMIKQGELSKLVRIQVDLPNNLDNLWTLDIKKSIAIPPEIIKKNLEAVIEKLAILSKRTWIFRGKKETGDKKTNIWNRLKSRDGFFYEINKNHPLIKLLYDNYPEIKNKLNVLFLNIETALPINQIYLDLNNDEKITNESTKNQEYIEQTLKTILESFKTTEDKIGYIKNIENIEPYSSNPEITQKVLKELS